MAPLRCRFFACGEIQIWQGIPKEKARKHHSFGLFLYVYFFKCGRRLICRGIPISAHAMPMDAPLHFSSGILLCCHFAPGLSGGNHSGSFCHAKAREWHVFYGEHLPACRESICAFLGKSKIRRQLNRHFAIYKKSFSFCFFRHCC